MLGNLLTNLKQSCAKLRPVWQSSETKLLGYCTARVLSHPTLLLQLNGPCPTCHSTHLLSVPQNQRAAAAAMSEVEELRTSMALMEATITHEEAQHAEQMVALDRLQAQKAAAELERQRRREASARSHQLKRAAFGRGSTRGSLWGAGSASSTPRSRSLRGIGGLSVSPSHKLLASLQTSTSSTPASPLATHPSTPKLAPPPTVSTQASPVHAAEAAAFGDQRSVVSEGNVPGTPA